ncbi:hypothetical protein O53_5064 [Microcystis aeruginosa TAIHU98]|uniref:Uncharacterized protein n=1 Tax=Microcystis aeruginosa TAIHU98 TaxID=1134457 RepID=L7DZE1_MICAE|nr:hypothetical protein O53_5064 [Microcystis aeruginosa TAIHU98]
MIGFSIQELGDCFYLFSPHPHIPTPHTPHPTPLLNRI